MLLAALILTLAVAAPQETDSSAAEPTVRSDQPAEQKTAAEPAGPSDQSTEQKTAAEQGAETQAPADEAEAAAEPAEETPQALRDRKIQELLKKRQSRANQSGRQPVRRPTRRQVEAGVNPIPLVIQKPEEGLAGPAVLEPPEDYQQLAPPEAVSGPGSAAPEAAAETPPVEPASQIVPPLDPIQRSLMEVELLRQHLGAHPEDQGAQVRLGLAYLRLGRSQEAAEAFELALRKSPADPGLLVNLGSAEMQRGDLEAARRSFESALSFDPHYAHALFNLGALAEGEKRIDEAIRYYKEALRYDPKLGDLATNPALVRSQLARVAQLQLFIETRSSPSLTVAPGVPLLTTAPVELPPAEPPPAPEQPPAAEPDSIPPG